VTKQKNRSQVPISKLCGGDLSLVCFHDGVLFKYRSFTISEFGRSILFLQFSNSHFQWIILRPKDID